MRRVVDPDRVRMRSGLEIRRVRERRHVCDGVAAAVTLDPLYVAGCARLARVVLGVGEHFGLTGTTNSSQFMNLVSETNVTDVANRIERDLGTSTSDPSRRHGSAATG